MKSRASALPVFCRRVGQTPNPKQLSLSPPSRTAASASSQAGQSNNTENARPSIPPKTQNGLRNQFDATPYKPPTAHCESAPKIQNPKKSETTQQPKQQTKPAKPPKRTRANTPHTIFITSRTNLTISENRTERAPTQTPVTRDSGLNRHGSLPLPGGDCISRPSER